MFRFEALYVSMIVIIYSNLLDYNDLVQYQVFWLRKEITFGIFFYKTKKKLNRVFLFLNYYINRTRTTKINE